MKNFTRVGNSFFIEKKNVRTPKNSKREDLEDMAFESYKIFRYLNRWFMESFTRIQEGELCIYDISKWYSIFIKHDKTKLEVINTSSEVLFPHKCRLNLSIENNFYRLTDDEVVKDFIGNFNDSELKKFNSIMRESAILISEDQKELYTALIREEEYKGLDNITIKNSNALISNFKNFKVKYLMEKFRNKENISLIYPQNIEKTLTIQLEKLSKEYKKVVKTISPNAPAKKIGFLLSVPEKIVVIPVEDYDKNIHINITKNLSRVTSILVMFNDKKMIEFKNDSATLVNKELINLHGPVVKKVLHLIISELEEAHKNNTLEDIYYEVSDYVDDELMVEEVNADVNKEIESATN